MPVLNQMTRTLPITVVVCTRNRPRELERCLESLAGVCYPDFDVLVVDNASADEAAVAIAHRWGARYVRENKSGLSRARNRGAREASGDVVAYIDDDAVADGDWLRALAAEFADPQVGVVTGQTVPLKLETEAERLADRLLANICRERRVFCRETPGWFEAVSFGRAGDGMNMAFRRSCFQHWPGFDEHLGRGCLLDVGEEHYAFFQLVDRGYRLIFTPEAIVRHPFRSSMEELRERHAKDISAAGAYTMRLFELHPEYRCALLRLALRRIFRHRRNGSGLPREEILPRARVLMSWLAAVPLYCKQRGAMLQLD